MRRRASGIAAALLLAILLAILPAPAALAAQTGWVTTADSARLYHRIIGHGADTIIAIHGGPGLDHESIAGDFAVLGTRHTVIFYDQRGGGKSTLPVDTSTLVASRQVRDLDELRRHFGLARVTLVAHSYGPLLAASYAIVHPGNVKRMVFFGPVPPRRGDFWQRYAKNLNARLDSVGEWVTSLPQARLFTVPRAARFTYSERPELVWPEVEAFLGAKGK
jgi:pimeloyl-ACP methyl ester carboxylesterase